MNDRALRIRFELPRAELDRAQAEAAAHSSDFEAYARTTRFDAGHLFGRVHFDIALPFEQDPVLEFLQEKRGLNVEPPLTISLDQPVAHLLGQLSGAAVLTLHGEGARLIPLSGGKGAVGLDLRPGSLLLSLPLEAYAGVVAVPISDAARAIADAAASLQSLLQEHASALAGWSLLGFLRREERILRAVAPNTRASAVAPPTAELPETWDVARFALRGAPSLAEIAGQAEESGAHVVPYWDIAPLEPGGALAFTPVQPTGSFAARGALARLIFPGAVRTIEAGVSGNEEEAQRLRSRLRRPSAFQVAVDPDSALLGSFRDADGKLPLL